MAMKGIMKVTGVMKEVAMDGVAMMAVVTVKKEATVEVGMDMEVMKGNMVMVVVVMGTEGDMEVVAMMGVVMDTEEMKAIMIMRMIFMAENTIHMVDIGTERVQEVNIYYHMDIEKKSTTGFTILCITKCRNCIIYMTDYKMTTIINIHMDYPDQKRNLSTGPHILSCHLGVIHNILMTLPTLLTNARPFSMKNIKESKLHHKALL